MAWPTATSASERATPFSPSRRAQKRPPTACCRRPSCRLCSPPPSSSRDAVGFHVVNDPKTGVKIGAPTKLIAVRGGAKLDFASSSDPDLSALYARLSAGTPTRNVAYKAIKPDDFFVVSGQEGTAKFYTRFEKSEKANPPIRGFTFTYPASQAAELDRIAIAIANSFEAFPGPAAAPANTPAASAAPPPGPPGRAQFRRRPTPSRPRLRLSSRPARR